MTTRTFNPHLHHQQPTQKMNINSIPITTLHLQNPLFWTITGKPTLSTDPQIHSAIDGKSSFILQDETSAIRVVAFREQNICLIRHLVHAGSSYSISSSSQVYYSPSNAEIHIKSIHEVVPEHRIVSIKQVTRPYSDHPYVNIIHQHYPCPHLPTQIRAPTQPVHIYLNHHLVLHESNNSLFPCTAPVFSQFLCPGHSHFDGSQRNLGDHRPLHVQTSFPHSRRVECSLKPSVFIAHAGEDKEPFAVPLQRAFEKAGVSTFLDKNMRPGDHIPTEVINAAEQAKIALLILSPQFFARKWPLTELGIFLRRRKDTLNPALTGQEVPLIIPIFHRWKVRDCDDEKFYRSQAAGRVFLDEGALDPEHLEMFPHSLVFGYMREVKKLKGIITDERAFSARFNRGRYGCPVKTVLDQVLSEAQKPEGLL